MSGPLLGAALIVRDERDHLPACLASLRGLVDEVVVHDTGSVDGTPELARAAGARVVQGTWHGDFGRARTVALEACTARWVLSVDADERLVLPRRDALEHVLAGASDVHGVWIRNVTATGGGIEHLHARLLRRGAVTWQGALHEVPVRLDGGPAPCGQVPRGVARLDHLGYADDDLVRAKGARNLAIAEAHLARTAQTAGAPDALARAVLDVGRSAQSAGAVARAVEAYRQVRDLAPAGSRSAVVATQSLAELLLEHGPTAPVPGLVADLEAAGAGADYLRLLTARLHLAESRPEEALHLLHGLGDVVDAAGRRHDAGTVVDLRMRAASAAGRGAEAAALLVQSVAGHGRVRGRGPLLLEVFAGHAPDVVAEVLLCTGATHAAAVAAELAAQPDPGPAWARSLTRLAGAAR